MSTAATAQLRHGYTLGDLQRIARSAAAVTRTVGNYDDWYGDAFAAAAECLYRAERWIPEHDLFRAAQDALRDENYKNRSYRGCPRRSGGWGENGTAPNFVRYWQDATEPTPSPEGAVVERLALAQILPTLTPRQREVVAALAASDDHGAAKDALDGLSCYRVHLSAARRRFLALWHEDEIPSRPWGADHRNCSTRTSRMSRALRDRRRRKSGGVL